MRRKSFAFGPMAVDETADALEDLDHDFFLFHDAETEQWRLSRLLRERIKAERTAKRSRFPYPRPGMKSASPQARRSSPPSGDLAGPHRG